MLQSRVADYIYALCLDPKDIAGVLPLTLLECIHADKIEKYDKDVQTMAEEVKPFTLSIPQPEQDRLLSQLNNTQEPQHEILPGADNDYGMPQEWAKKLLHRWRTTFSWPATQAKINTFPQFTTSLEGLDIHFIHTRSDFPSAIPLLLIHGWPGSFYEFSEAIPLLSKPSDDSQQQAFHCIAPSLPGFCFSSCPQTRGWTVKDTARIFHALMLRLGYESYAVQAGDWGQFVARELGANPVYADSCRMNHLNYCPGALPETLREEDLSRREIAARERGVDWRTRHVGYAVLMRTRPQTLEWMLRDNALGLLGFVGEKYHEASSPAVHEDEKWMDHVLTTVCLYYFSRCIGTSGLIYFENAPHHLFAEYAVREENLIRCPLGYTSFWFDTAPNSKRAVERTGRLVFYKERDYAGHFAALEDPVGLSEDVRELVKGYWEP